MCKEIQLPTNRGPSSDSADIDEEGDSGASATAARGRAVTQALRKSLVHNTIPIFVELKRLLESKNSPLIGSLMECLRVLLKDYKNDIDEILVADKQLQKELMYDMQKYEKAKAKSTAAEVIASGKRTSSFDSPDVSKIASGKHVPDEYAGKVQDESKLALAMADATAEAMARSVLKEVSKGKLTPPLSALSAPKLKTDQGRNQRRSNSGSDRPLHVLESLRKRQNFDSDGEN